MSEKMKFIIAVYAAFTLFFYIGCGVQRENIVIDGKSRAVCGWEKKYVIKSPGNCGMIKYGCSEGEKIFMDNRGCGCAEPVFCGSGN